MKRNETLQEKLTLADGWVIESHRSDSIYDIITFARDEFPRFLSLVDLLSPRDAEIMLCFAVLKKRPTDLSILFGKAGHRAEEDLHKAAHKLAGLVEFGPLPEIRTLDEILRRCFLSQFGRHSLAACLWEYARCRDFAKLSSLAGPGLRQYMLRVFKILHASTGRDEGLLAGWILWLVDGSDPHGKGWRTRKRQGYGVLGPTVFRTFEHDLAGERKATQHGGRGQRPNSVKITRHMKFILRGANV
jgi:hypothetical protein